MAEKLELLAPAGTLQTLKAVIHAGADAVYFGGSQFGARAYAGNFNQEEVLEAIDFAHLHGSKVFMAVNTLLKEKEIEEQLYEYLLPYYEQGLDGVIVQDYGVLQFVKRNFPMIPIHTSTQMTVTNAEGAEFLAKAGASRIVMARELSLEEIHRIHEAVPVELESFVHGALCYCYSGQCLFSSMLGGRSGNRGRCAQPCRLPYEVYNAKGRRINDKQHLYPLSPKDLCTIDMLPQLAKSGIYSFKIEGRMKRTEYAAGVVSVYRKYMDRYLNYGAEDYSVSKEDRKKLFDFGNRSGFTEGYYTQWNGPDMITFEKPGHEKSNDALWKQIAEDYIQSECKEKITGTLKVEKDTPVTLTVSYQDKSVTVTGDVAVAAQKQPITEETLRSKLNKTGNTPFIFENLDIQLEDGLFLTMGAVNELRRQALDALQEQCVNSYRRSMPEVCHEKQVPKTYQNMALPADTTESDEVSRVIAGNSEKATSLASITETSKKEAQQPYITASVEAEAQLEPLLRNPMISAIYVDSTTFRRDDIVAKLKDLSEKTKNSNKQIFYTLPAIFRSKTAEFYADILQRIEADGFLVKSYDALSFLLKQKVLPDKIRIDHNLYTWSKESRMAFDALGIQGDTLPLELNRKEIRRRDNTGSEMLIYGYLPLMTSVQCVNKNLCGCDGRPKVHYLKDRYGVSFPVKNHCQECYNVLYNSKPLYLFSVMEELQSFGISRFRLSFTTESKEQVEKILEICSNTMSNAKDYLPEDMKDYTYGHYKRGVE